MPYAILERKIKALPVEYLTSISDYIDFLQYKVVHHSKKTTTPKRQLGLLKGQIWIAPDFDETPDDFAEYI